MGERINLSAHKALISERAAMKESLIVEIQTEREKEIE